MIDARVYGYLDDEGTQKIGGTITASGGRYDDIKAVQWDDGITSDVAEHNRGISWDYEDDAEDRQYAQARTEMCRAVKKPRVAA